MTATLAFPSEDSGQSDDLEFLLLAVDLLLIPLNLLNILSTSGEFSVL